MHNMDREQSDRAIALLQMLLRTETVSPPGNECILARKIAAWLAQQGLDSRLEELGNNRANLIVRLPGKNHRKNLLFTGHMDTVPVGDVAWSHSPLGAERVGDRMYGRGAADMKSGLAAMLAALGQLKQAGSELPQDVVLLATAGEEEGCLGASAFVQKGGMEEFGAVVVGEPSNGDVMVAHKGTAWIEIVAYGHTAHGSMPDLGVNAVVAMNKIIDKLLTVKFNVKPDFWLGKPTISVNRIGGGVAMNVVPDQCTCWVDFRLIPGQGPKDVEQILDNILADLKRSETNFKADYHFVGYHKPITCPDGHPIIALASQIAEKVTGSAVKVRGVNFFTDASELLAANNLPVIIYGPGNDAIAHQPDEYVEIAKYLTAIEFYKAMARKVTGDLFYNNIL